MTLFAMLLIPGLAAPAPRPADFDGLQCGPALDKQLAGRKMSARPASELEKAYQSLKLKNIGGDDLDHGFFNAIWEICGDKYLLLLSHDTIADAVKLPPLSEAPLPVSTACKRNGQDVADVLPVLKPGAKESESNVQAAWQIDFKKKKLKPLEASGLICPLKP